MRGRLLFGLLVAALFSSGAAGLINQVVWQRGLKVFLSGSESISAMIVVLIFMAGLGVGAMIAARFAGRLKDPLRVLGLVELFLGGVNLIVCSLLATDLSASVLEAQRIALAIGVPLWVVYAVSSLLVLAAPCVLMGATMPLAAEVCQRKLALTESRVLGRLLFFNTFGSVLGSLLASGFLLARLGQQTTLIFAASLNLLAGAVLLLGLTQKSEEVSANQMPTGQQSKRPTSRLELISLILGFCSLGFEMHLFRVFSLRHQPLPFTFSAVLTGFLFYWSLGAALSSTKIELSLRSAFRLCGLLIAMTIPMFVIDPTHPASGTASLLWLLLTRFVYFLPCVLFGFSFGRVVAAAANSWGADVGRLYVFNTLGSCAGVLLFTLVGFEMPFLMVVLVLALLLYALHEAEPAQTQPRIPRWVFPAVGAALSVLVSFVVDLSGLIRGLTIFYGREGVIGIDAEGNMLWDGLWHSKLSINNDHVGTKNWAVGVMPVLASQGPIQDACVIGLATGITAATLAKTGAAVDAYEINPDLNDIYERFPDGTLHIASTPNVRIIWRDARSSLSLDEKRYDLIQTQPLYLKQAGSSLLNSVEFYQLVSKRLKPTGIFSLYSNGTAAQALLIRQTASKVFPYRASFFNGYLLLLSHSPIVFTEEALSARLQQTGPFWDEVRGYGPTKDAASILRLMDPADFPWGDQGLLNTDDHPLVEYPSYLQTLMEERGYTSLPAPGKL